MYPRPRGRYNPPLTRQGAPQWSSQNINAIHSNCPALWTRSRSEKILDSHNDVPGVYYAIKWSGNSANSFFLFGPNDVETPWENHVIAVISQLLGAYVLVTERQSCCCLSTCRKSGIHSVCGSYPRFPHTWHEDTAKLYHVPLYRFVGRTEQTHEHACQLHVCSNDREPIYDMSLFSFLLKVEQLRTFVW